MITWREFHTEDPQFWSGGHLTVTWLFLLPTGKRYISLLARKKAAVTILRCGSDSIVGIATGYRLDGPGIESRWRQDFPHLSRPALGPTKSSVQWVPGLSRVQRVTRPWRWPFTPFQCRGHERIELYLYFLFGPYGLYRASVPVQGCTLPFF